MPARLDDHVTDVPRVAGVAVEQPAVEDDPAADTGRHDHPDEVPGAPRRAAPALTERERLGVVVDPNRKVGTSCQPGTKGEGAPCGNVERRHVLTVRIHRAAATDADPRHTRAVERVDELDQRAEQHFGVALARRGCVDPRGERAVVVHQTCRQLGAADVDRNDVGHGGRG